MSDELNQKEWEAAYDAFKAKYPDCPEVQDIECLNLIMKREFAEEILQGKKTVEFRSYSKHYCERMYDKAMGDFIDRHKDDEEVLDAVGELISPLRFVKKIHFHNYNNTWYLDCTVSLNDVVAVTRDDVEYMQEELNCHELDEELAYLEKMKENRRPMYFYYVIDKVLGTNLK